MQTFWIVFCLCLMLISGVAAAMFRSNLKSAISLGLASLFLAIIMFIMNAPWAALFELSVCAGLVTAIFVSTISMTTRERHSQASVDEYRKRFATLPFILILTGVALIIVVFATGFELEPVSAEVSNIAATFKEAFWETRQADILGQIFIILAGAFAVTVLFKESDKA